MEYAIFIWDGKPNNYINVCFQSLRLYNQTCNIKLYYSDETFIENYKHFNINFIKIDKNEAKNRLQYYKILITKNLLDKIDKNDKILILDCDLLFQNDPFNLFNDKQGDIYYTHSILSTPDSLREKSIWENVEYKVNGGVWGIIKNENSIKLMDFWIKNLLDNSWDKWLNFKLHIDHGIKNLNWWVDQDFLNCIDNHELPFQLKKVIFSYKFNYFTSTWGFFNENLEMGTKIGNPEYCIIHFKANFKDVYNLEDPKIYNMENILAKKKLTTKKSIDTITKKFLSRGEKRFTIV